jgi:Tfp pilus assembly protein PilF
MSLLKIFSAVLIASLTAAATGCRSTANLPQQGSPAYYDAVAAFDVGLAALQVGDDVRADSKLQRATQLAPGEPAAWANWGLLALRQRNLEAAGQRLEKARDLAPQNDQIYYLLGLLESNRGNFKQAIAHLHKATEINPRNLRASYLLAELLERQGGADSEAESQAQMQKILAVQPGNLAAQLELARLAAKRGDAAALHSVLAQISSRSSGWPPEVQQQVKALQSAASGKESRAAATRTVFLRNVLMRVPEFRQDLSAIKPPPGDEAQPFTHLLALATPEVKPAPADLTMRFNTEPIPGFGDGSWSSVEAISLGSSGAPVVAVANGHEVRLANGAKLVFPGGPSGVAPSPEGILPIDFNYDFKNDLVLAGAGGLRFLRQDEPNTFTDVTARTRLPKSILNASYTAAWTVDIEADGDLDIVLGATNGLPTVLRNNGDGTFTVTHPFAGIAGLRGFAWADFDGDGDPDAALLDGNQQLHVFENLRVGQFQERRLPAGLATVKALNVADADNDGRLDLLVVQADGAILRLSDKNDGQGWEMAELARTPDAATYLAGDVRLQVADLDNNGSLDLILAQVASPNQQSANGPLIWLGDQGGRFALLPSTPGPALVFATADVNGDGRLDLLGLSADKRAVEGVNRGSVNYHWQIIRPRAKQAVGDQRINPFGVGGEIEVRAGSLLQKQPITGPLLHFGLGNQASTDIVRIVWPNGSVRAEFELKADQEVVAEQRLKGSCPFLFAFNGKQMEFVKDAVPWGSAIGLRINMLGTARVEATEEWYKIGRDQLAPRDGYYDLRITAELWETYYYDQLSLMTVDHPAGTEIFVDERFAVPPVKLTITAVEPPHEIQRAVDDTGQDVTEVVRTLDERYLDTFGRGQYQGITRDHYVELDLGDDVPAGRPLWLIAQGWMHPTDSSINVAVSQGRHEAAQGLSIEVPDGHGGWRVAQSHLGFPAGRKKICLFDLTNVFRPGTPHRLRLRTNLEIYWDSIQWAQGRPDTPLRVTELDPSTADLHYRGYSVIHQPNASSPEVPDYNHLSGSKQRWRDLVGYYTRFGDVRELLAKADDRYVIMNAGDEMSFRFPVPPPPPPGWVRDFVVRGDGWIKDGDYNSTFSRTVLPLPYHARQQYTTPPGRLEDEYVYRRHPEDWQSYQTRYVTPQIFEDALKSAGR